MAHRGDMAPSAEMSVEEPQDLGHSAGREPIAGTNERPLKPFALVRLAPEYDTPFVDTDGVLMRARPV